MAFFYGFTPKEVNEMDARTAMMLLRQIPAHRDIFAGKMMGKAMGL
jgi:hypothetical protein